MSDTLSRAGTASPEGDSAGEEELIEDEILLEEISIDGMCGVY